MQQIDWRAYAKEFSDLHGGNPSVYKADKTNRIKGFLLFRDGWMYGLNHPSGPEYMPPADINEHKNLVKWYWIIRIRVLSQELKMLKTHIRDLVQSQQKLSAPIQVTMFKKVENDDGKFVQRRETDTIDFTVWLDKAEELRSDMDICIEYLSKPIELTDEMRDVHTEDQFPDMTPAVILDRLEQI